jgi:hypothetical protein
MSDLIARNRAAGHTPRARRAADGERAGGSVQKKRIAVTGRDFDPRARFGFAGFSPQDKADIIAFLKLL